MRFVLNLARRARRVEQGRKVVEALNAVEESAKAWLAAVDAKRKAGPTAAREGDMLGRIFAGCIVEDFENDSWAAETLGRLENRVRLAIATGCAREVLGALFAACIEEDFDNAIYAVAVLGRLEDRIRIAMASGVL